MLRGSRCDTYRVERELVRQCAFFRVPPKFNRVFFAIELASTGCVETRTINIEPVTGVSFFGLNKANEYERFVVRRLIGKTVMQLDVVMLKGPFTVHRALSCAAVSHFSFHTPVADKVIEERILQLRRRRRLSESNSEQQGGKQQIFQCFHRL